MILLSDLCRVLSTFQAVQFLALDFLRDNFLTKLLLGGQVFLYRCVAFDRFGNLVYLLCGTLVPFLLKDLFVDQLLPS